MSACGSVRGLRTLHATSLCLESCPRLPAVATQIWGGDCTLVGFPLLDGRRVFSFPQKLAKACRMLLQQRETVESVESVESIQSVPGMPCWSPGPRRSSNPRRRNSSTSHARNARMRVNANFELRRYAATPLRSTRTQGWAKAPQAPDRSLVASKHAQRTPVLGVLC